MGNKRKRSLPSAAILRQLTAIARKRRIDLGPAAFELIGVSKTNYVLRLNENETILHLHYIVAQTVHQGCCYYEPSVEEPGISESLIGTDALDLETYQTPIYIAALDAVFGSMKRAADEVIVLKGENIAKAGSRAEVVCKEALRLLPPLSTRKGNSWTIANVGVIGSILALLRKDAKIHLLASDFYTGVAGKEVNGVRVEYGQATPSLVAESDVAIVTGMSLSNGTLPEILRVSKRNGTKLVMFTETGANFAEEYVRMGVDVVVAEPFPFYLVGPGDTRLEVYRRRNGDQGGYVPQQVF